MATKEEMFEAIMAYVRAERAKDNISESKLATKSRREGSCWSGGEYRHLVDGQLVRTADGYCDWQALLVPENLLGCYEYVMYGKSGYKGD